MIATSAPVRIVRYALLAKATKPFPDLNLPSKIGFGCACFSIAETMRDGGEAISILILAILLIAMSVDQASCSGVWLIKRTKNSAKSG